LPIVIVGHVDHGKSTLVGRLLNDTGSLPEGKVEALREMSRRRGMPFEWSFVMDALQAERDQGITIDTTQVRFRTATRPYVIIDAPGHKEFLKNMVTGAASADAALLLIDVTEGALEQSRRHAYLLHLLGVRQVAVVINKMDMCEFSEARYHEVAAGILDYLSEIGVTPSAVVPVSARFGNNIVERCRHMTWYTGPTVTEALDAFSAPKSLVDLPLRLPVQDVYKFDERRIIAGRIESGQLAVGDTLVFLPGNRSARVQSIESWNESEPRTRAVAGQSVGVTLDQPIFIERGAIAALASHRPVETHSVRAHLFWLGHEPLTVGRRYTLKLATAEHQVTVQAIERVIDVQDLSGHGGDQVERNGVGVVVLHSRTALVADDFTELPRTGRAVLVSGYDVVGGCILKPPQAEAKGEAKSEVVARNLVAPRHVVGFEERGRANGHLGGVLWFTGLSGAGKSTLAVALERELFLKGLQVAVLDGDGIRQGLNADLGFSPPDRSENIRRVAEVARLFAEAGVVAITALISPTRSDRALARSIGGPLFHEIHIGAALAVCEARDIKGHYRKARAGLITEFTGVTAPYEEPLAPELALDTGTQPIEASLAELVAYVERHLIEPVRATPVLRTA
jgi:bifunctional enzyme CysN/CysC